MLETTVTFRHGSCMDLISFMCPFCENPDLLYTSMPHTCWHCGGPYSFNVMELMNDKHSRYNYYKYGRTID